MPTKTVYVRPADEPVWAEFQRVADDEQVSMSAMLADLIRRFLEAGGLL
jgi:hypothetical protein